MSKIPELPEFRMCDHTDRLTPVPRKKNTYHCPVCNGNNLEVKPDSTYYKCFNGCDNKAVRDAVRPLSEAIESIYPKKTIQGEERRSWVYTDTDGVNCIKVVRVDDGFGKKRIFQEFAINGLWVTDCSDEEKIQLKTAVSIYRLTDIRKAISEGQPIFWVEGEKCADMLWDLGLPATTSIGGTSAYRRYSDYGDPLRDANLIICPDQDIPGQVYADKVFSDHPQAQWLYAFPESAAWKNLPKDKGVDIADWITQKKVTAIDIMSAIESERREYNDAPEDPADDWAMFCKQVKSLMETVEHPVEREFRLRQICASYKMPISMGQQMIQMQIGKVKKFEPIDVVDFMESNSSDREWLIAGHLPLGGVINLCAMGGTGKTSLAYEWAKAIATGTPWNQYPVHQTKALILQSDEPETDAREKLDIQEYYEVPAGCCEIYFNWTSSQMDDLAEYIDKKGIGFVVIDSLAAINLGVDRNSTDFADNLRILRGIASDKCCTFLVLDHTNKAGGNLGTIAVHNAVSEMMYLKYPTDDEKRIYLNDNAKGYRILTWEKSRSGLAGTKFVLRQNPIDYTNEHLGNLESMGEGGDQEMHRQIIAHITSTQERIKPDEFAALWGFDSKVAHEKLESLRRTGLLRGEWVVPEKGTHQGKRWREYYPMSASADSPAIDNPAMAKTVATLERFTITDEDDGPIEVEYTFSGDDW